MTLVYAGIAVLLAVLGAGVWIFEIHDEYRQTYFDRPCSRPPVWQRAVVVAITLAAAAAAGLHLPQVAWPFATGVAVALLGVFVIDWSLQVIPDRVQLLGLASTAGLVLVTRAYATAITDALCGTGIAAALWGLTALYERVRRRQALGLGDIKLLGWLGILLGANTAVALLYALVAAGITMIPVTLWRKQSLRQAFAFGPFLVLGVLFRMVEIAL